MKLKIATVEGVHETEGETVTIMGHKCFVSEAEDETEKLFTVSEYKSGLRICSDTDRNKAIISAADILSDHPYEQLQKAVRGQLQFHGIEYPLNS